MNMNRITTGIMAATAPADIMSHLGRTLLPRDATETGSVLLLEVVRNMTANKYSFLRIDEHVGTCSDKSRFQKRHYHTI